MVLCCLLVRHGKQFSFLLIYCIFMMGCKPWVDKKCSGTFGELLEDEDFRCDRYCARSDKGFPYYSDTWGTHIEGFRCILQLRCHGYCKSSSKTWYNCQNYICSRKFSELLPLLTNRYICTKNCKKVFDVYI